jgi:hypothetical protein
MTQISRSKLQELIAEVRKWDKAWTKEFAASFHDSSADYWAELYADKLRIAWDKLEEYVSNSN